MFDWLTNQPAWHFVVFHVSLQALFVARALLRPRREPAARMAWALVIIMAPVVGLLAYALFGETNIGRKRVARARAAEAALPDPGTIGVAPGTTKWPEVGPEYERLFHIGKSISGFEPVPGNRATLMPDSDSAIDAMIADIDAARSHVHLAFYIWLPDTNGLKMVEALKRAAARGVTCRAMADDLGSRRLIRSPHWQAMKDAGIHVTMTLPIGNPFLRVTQGRIDLRNHRKILVIDNAITYCGSQNCADPAFLPKAKFAPWVDIMLRFEGPVVRQNQHLFAVDWMAETQEDLTFLFDDPLPPEQPGFAAQAIGTGPTVRPTAMPEVFTSLMYAARHELIVTTPYYVPDEPIQAALCASARRGVHTTVIFPERNDSWLVGAASRSYYDDLIEAGVRIHQYRGGLLHTKSITVDGKAALIGSANLDRRSFELNFENNILLVDDDVTAQIRARQHSYLAQSDPVLPRTVENWHIGTRLWNNALAMFGPIL